jgi:hypothetical protein
LAASLRLASSFIAPVPAVILTVTLPDKLGTAAIGTSELSRAARRTAANLIRAILAVRMCVTAPRVRDAGSSLYTCELGGVASPWRITKSVTFVVATDTVFVAVTLPLVGDAPMVATFKGSDSANFLFSARSHQVGV